MQFDIFQLVTDQIQAARTYTLNLLAQIPQDFWYEKPQGCPTHIGWQLGHLAMAEFRLGIAYFREPTETDLAVLPDDFIAPFRAGTKPGNATEYPAPDDLLDRLAKVHAYVLDEIPKINPQLLHQPLRIKHRINKTGMDSLMWIARHESLHAGQIGLIRRLHGLDSVS